jgi:hypothetical protein
MEHPLRPLLGIAKVFLNFFPNLVTLKTSATRCSPCSVHSSQLINLRQKGTITEHIQQFQCKEHSRG